jgi:hypothetical protein
MVLRITTGRQFAVWEVPYNDPDAIKNFVVAMENIFEPKIMTETMLFVNHGNNGAFQSFFAAGFPEQVFPHLQPVLNEIVGVIRNFTLTPELLLAMAVQGLFSMESSVTPAKVDRAYAGKPAQAS